MKKTLLLSFIIACCSQASLAQHFGLYNSRTLYDVFENPSQSAYQIDTSRRIAFNFFIPTISIKGAFSGPAGSAFKTLLYDGQFNADGISIGQNEMNTLTLSTNTYLAMLRILHRIEKSQEIGLSWQVRNDGRVKVTNETLAIFDDINLFTGVNYADLFNNRGDNQSYHQFSLSYRQNVSKRLSIGVKGSLLSGITYHSFKIWQSALDVDPATNSMSVSLGGKLYSNYDLKREMQQRDLYPFFKNPGLAFSAGAGYRFRNGVSVIGNLKDIGFIRWNKASQEYLVEINNLTINDASDPTADDRLADQLEDEVKKSPFTTGSYTSALNGKIEALVSKDFNNYKPNIVLSKNLFYGGGDIVMNNNYHLRNYVFTLMADYNMDKYLAVGGQLMIKTPNVEFYMGSDNLFKTVEVIRSMDSNSGPYPASHSAASFYMGFGLKFGRLLQHPANADRMPDPERGLFKKLFKKN